MENVHSTDPDSASPHVALLTRSFSLVPPAAVPAIIDCVISSSQSLRSQLFSSLLHSFPDLSKAYQSNHILSYTSALCHLIKNYEGLPDSLRLFLCKICIPLLKTIDPKDSELLNEIEGLLIDVISETQSWELLGETVVPYCLRSLCLSAGMIRNDDLVIYKWSSEDSLEFPGTLLLPIACRILTSLLNSALRIEREKRSCDQKLEGFAANLTWDLSNLALGMLMQSPADRSFCIRLLLPTVFRSLSLFSSVEVLVHGLHCILSRVSFTEKIWKCCISLFSLGHLERLDAYAILSLYFSSFYSLGRKENAAPEDIRNEFDIRARNEFWEEIRKGLVDRDGSLRKQALYILKVSLSNYCSALVIDGQCVPGELDAIAEAKNYPTVACNGSASHANTTKRDRWAEKEAKSLGVGEVCHLGDCLSGLERWKVFLLLYEMLEEYGTHLVEAAWTHQVSLLFQSMPLKSYLDPVTFEVYEVQMETVEGIFSWLAVLWERGFFHDNPQVRCLIMQSFLGIDWDKHGNCAQKVPRSFVLGSLVMGLNDAVHHQNFGVKGVYTSETIQGASKYFFEFSRHLSLSERLAFIWGLASVARQEAFSRPGLMSLAFCIASASCPSVTHNPREHHREGKSSELAYVKSAQKLLLPSTNEDLLDVLGIVIERSKQHFNPNYRLQVCQQVIKAASSLMNLYHVPLDVLLHFLSTVPREFTDCAGPLREMVQRWLTQISDKGNGFGSFITDSNVLKNILCYPTSFIKYRHSSDGSICFDDEDVDAWGVEAQRWARVLFLVVGEAQHLEPIFTFFRNYCSSLCKWDGGTEWSPSKLLILFVSFVEELQNEWRKLNSYSNYAKSGKECGRKSKSNQSSPFLTSSDCGKFTGAFLSIMVELVSFSKLVSPVFWSMSEVKESHLPCSIRGRLGGPSQRRLASLTSSSVLQAILSLRAVACTSICCAQLGGDEHLDFSFAFLWDFSWKVIQPQNYNSETAAELCLAGYEALTYVFKAWFMTLNPSVFDLIVAYNTSLFSGEDMALLDPMVLCFLNNINDVLAKGALTRSRRAVLMKWKWLCLDSLLSLPYYNNNGGHIKKALPFFSDSTLRNIFADIVESLENAGESSVLPMLRSVRLILQLLCSMKTSLTISSCAGVNCQMMQQFVHSSWVLHLSCNKRRVAPIAALLSAVLHPLVFGDLKMHETNGIHQGPLKWFIESLLEEGVKSPRTIRLAALHLTGLWLLHPKTIKYYIKELKFLSLYGSVAFDEDFEGELSENHEARTEVSFLAKSPDCELTEAWVLPLFGEQCNWKSQAPSPTISVSSLSGHSDREGEVFINTELYARVSVAVLFYQLANLAKKGGKQEDEDSQAAFHCGKMFLLEMLDSAVKDKDLSKELYKKYSAVHRRKVRAWQMICILSHFVEKDIVEEVTSNLHICLYRNNLPAVRQYLETFAMQVYLKFPTLAEEQLIPIFYNYNMKPQALSSYVFIAANIILHANDVAIQIRHLNELLPPIIPLLTSHHHSLRGFTQLLVHYVLSKLWPSMKTDGSDVAALEKKCFEDLKSYLAENNDCMRLRTSMEGFLDVFDPNASSTPAGVFKPRNEGSAFECVPISLMEQVITFLNDVRDDLRNSIAKDAVTIKNEGLTAPETSIDMVAALDVNTKRVSSNTPNDISLDFQKKITLYEYVQHTIDDNSDGLLGNAEFCRLLSALEKEDQLLSPMVQSRNQAMERIRGSQQQFILVASLLDRIPNLAGLARTCEVFKAAGLAVANATVVQDKQFQLISVTAEKWVPIIEVPVCSMKVFLEGKRREGFSILGLEQTANSTPLDQYSFPNKTVLVLGREKEGIPVDIIHALDACIEIPQLGIVRSLNVHVSGAIALWEYTRQQRSKRSSSSNISSFQVV